MKKNLPILLSFLLAFYSISVSAQVKPDDRTNEIHFYDFEDGSADDFIGDAHGQLKGGATISNGMLDITNPVDKGGFVNIPGDIVNINSYNAITAEVWCIPSTNTNKTYNMTWCFGTTETEGTLGFDYLFFTTGRGDNGETKVGLSHGTWDSEQGPGIEGNYGDSALHHYVVTLQDSIATIYVDSEKVASDTMDKFHTLDSVSNDSVFIGRGGYVDDPTWKGKVDLFSIWDIALSPEEVQWLYEQGSKRGLPEASGIEDRKLPENPVNFYVTDNRLFARNVQDVNDLSVTIYSISGRMIYQNNRFQNGEYLKLDQGVYIIKSRYLNNTSVQKIVIR